MPSDLSSASAQSSLEFGASPPPIPKIIHAIWLQGRDKAPDLVRENFDRWERLNPDYDLRVLNRQDVFTLLDKTGQDLERFRPQALANIARLQLLKNQGGVWVDATLYPAKPLSDWLDDVAKPGGFFAFRNPGPDRLLAVWFLVASRENPVISIWLNELLRFWQEEHHPAPTYEIPSDPVAAVAPGMGRADKRYPYFAFAYTFAYLVETDPEFRAFWDRCADLSADPAHAIQFALDKRPKLSDAELRTLLDGCGVHKLNWRNKLHPSVARALYDEGARHSPSAFAWGNRVRDEASWLVSRVARKAGNLAKS